MTILATAPRKYRKKPVEIEAMQFTGVNIVAVGLWISDCGGQCVPSIGSIDIVTLEGTMTANPQDWIVRGVQGEFYPVKSDIFEVTYEEVQ